MFGVSHGGMGMDILGLRVSYADYEFDRFKCIFLKDIYGGFKNGYFNDGILFDHTLFYFYFLS